MNSKGFVGGPFQLLIGIVVFGMAIVIGFQLISMVQCWKCNELLKTEAINLRETIATVGNSDIGSKLPVTVKLQDLGACAKAIYLRQVDSEEDPELRCESFCPEHPNSCWVILTESTCGGEGISIECIDIRGDTVLEDPDNVFGGKIADSYNDWIKGSYAFTTTTLINVVRTSPDTVEIRKPG